MISGKVLETVRGPFGDILAETGEVREFAWGDVVAAGQYVTFGVRGARNIVRVSGAVLQVAASNLDKANKRMLSSMLRGVECPSRCPRNATQMVVWSAETPDTDAACYFCGAPDAPHKHKREAHIRMCAICC